MVSYLVNEVGIRQFLGIGTGPPVASSTHGVAQRAAPESRIVYVDNDPIVLAHARALLTSDPRGASDLQAASVSEGSRRYNERSAVALQLRTKADVTAMFGSFGLVPPGVVQLDRWQPGGPTPDTDDSGITAYGALGRKS